MRGRLIRREERVVCCCGGVCGGKIRLGIETRRRSAFGIYKREGHLPAVCFPGPVSGFGLVFRYVVRGRHLHFGCALFY